MTNSTLEKVARAIIRARHATCCKNRDFSNFVLSPLDLDLARAALQELRQVDDSTVQAMRLCIIRNSRPVDPAKPFESPFTAAIDSILTEGGEG